MTLKISLCPVIERSGEVMKKGVMKAEYSSR